MSLFLLRCSLYLYEAHFVLQYPLYNSITYKFQSLFWECSIRKEVSSRYFNWLFSQASNRFHKGYHAPPLWRTSQFDNILMYCWSHEPFDFPNLKINFIAFKFIIISKCAHPPPHPQNANNNHHQQGSGLKPAHESSQLERALFFRNSHGSCLITHQSLSRVKGCCVPK